jgi:hypothetical protein
MIVFSTTAAIFLATIEYTVHLDISATVFYAISSPQSAGHGRNN